MSPRQIAGVAERKVREFLVPTLPIDFDRRYEQRVPDTLSTQTDPFAANTALLRDSLDVEHRRAARERAQSAAEGSPSFLNRTLDITADTGIDWYDEGLDDLPRLWRLKLYGFEPLWDLTLGYSSEKDASGCRAAFDDWIRYWLEKIVVGEHNYLRRAWTPYAVSLRLRHWIRYVAWCKARDRTPGEDRKFERAFAREIYKNALFLRAHVERDVGGNHLVENGAALVAAGLFFDDDHGFADRGVAILSETTDQFLHDGCHFERSPMYHILCLTRLLTVCDLLDRTGQTVPAPILSTTRSATEFLEYLRPPDDRIPLLNDAVYGQSLSLRECLSYAMSIIDITADGSTDPVAPGTSDPSEGSGYHWLDNEAGSLLVDGGPVGPKHLPGHAHSDILNVLLWVDGYPVVTDTGTFDYEAGEYRRYARGVIGHNTVQVDETEPIALGGRFLMGPRSVPVVDINRGGISLFEGRYDAKPLDNPGYSHHRSIFSGDQWWLVWDTVAGEGITNLCSRLHLHPDVDVRDATDERIRFVADDEVEVFAYPLTREQVTTTERPYFHHFGASADRSVLELDSADRGTGTVTSGFLVATRNVRPSITQDGPLPKELTVNDRTYQLPPLRFLGG